LEILVRSLPSDGIVVLARLTLLVHLKLHVEERVRQEGFVVFHRAAFPNLRELWFRWEAPCLVFEAGTMPRLRSLAQGARQADGVLDGIQHLGSLVEFKVHVYERKGYISRMLRRGDGKRPRVEEQRRWDGTSLKAALKEAISKHPGSLRVVIEDM
jgi:disease resistance protein RPM1